MSNVQHDDFPWNPDWFTTGSLWLMAYEKIPLEWGMYYPWEKQQITKGLVTAPVASEQLQYFTHPWVIFGRLPQQPLNHHPSWGRCLIHLVRRTIHTQKHHTPKKYGFLNHVENPTSLGYSFKLLVFVNSRLRRFEETGHFHEQQCGLCHSNLPIPVDRNVA